MPKKKRINKSGQKRARNSDLRKRIEEVKNWLLAGIPRSEIISAIEVAYKIANSRAYAYVKRAETEIWKIAELNREQWLAEHIAIRRRLRRRANESGDIEFELRCAEDEAKLLGLYAPIKQEIAGRDGGPIRHDHAGEITVTHRYANLTAAFLDEIAGSPTQGSLSINDRGKPVDPGLDQGRSDN